MVKKFNKFFLLMTTITLLVGCASFEVTPTEALTIEYGEDLKYELLFNAETSSEGAKVLSVVGYDSKKVGEQEIKVTFTDEKEKKEIESIVKVNVEDTQEPSITLSQDKVEITEGDELEIKGLVKEVKDPVDGVIAYSDKQVDVNAWYIDNEGFDFQTEGTYQVKIIANDVNGNSSEAIITVIVNPKPVEIIIEEEPAYVDETYSDEITQNIIDDNNNDEQEVIIDDSDSNEVEEFEYVDLNNESLQSYTDAILDSILYDGMDDIQRLYTIYKWVESNIQYDANFYKSDWQTMAEVALSRRRGNCFGYYATSRALLTAAGYQSDMAAFPGETHVWNRVCLNGIWYHFDTTTGWGGDRFLLTDDELRAYRYGDLYYAW